MEAQVDVDEEPVEAEVVAEGPDPELAPAVDEFLPGAMSISNPRDQHEVMVVMDNHDTAMLLEQVQSAALRKWVYELPGNKGVGLTVHAMQDIVQRMNWTRKCRIGLVVESLVVEHITANQGQGDEPFWVATVFARDEMTGSAYAGTSMEPQRMHLRPETAEERRAKGDKIPEDNTVFDKHSRTKAIQKAQRNALAAFIPEEIEQTVIAMFKNDPQRVERIQTDREAEAEKLPPPLDDEEMTGLIAEADAIYETIKDAGAGQGKIKLPPGTFNALKHRVMHSHDRMREFLVYLQERAEAIPLELAREARIREAVEKAREVACPKCERARFKPCAVKGGAHPERVQASLEKLGGAL